MTSLALRTLQVRVNKSAKELDKSQKGWEKKINLPSFDMQYSSKCIAGQLGLPNTHDEKRGFFLPMYVPIMHKGKNLGAAGVFSYKVLTRLWKHQINKRLKAKSKPKKASKPAFHGC